MSMDQNSALLSSRLAADIARDQVSSAFGGHLPIIDLVAGRTYSDRAGDATYRTPTGNQLTFNDATTYGNSVALQLTMPIFNGGGTSSRVRQSQYRWIAAKERLERTSRATEGNARDAYQGVNSDIARVQALQAGRGVEPDRAEGRGSRLRSRHAHHGRRAHRAAQPDPGAAELLIRQVRLPQQPHPAAADRRCPRPWRRSRASIAG